MKNVMKRTAALLLALALVAGQVAIPTSAEEMDIPSIPGGESTEKAEVTVTVTDNGNGTVTATAETAKGGDTTDSGLTVEVKSEKVIRENDKEDPADDKVLSEDTTYKVESADGSYTAQGGTQSSTVENEAQAGDDVTVDLVDENGNLVSNSAGGAVTGGEATPTNEGGNTQAQDPNNFDQTTVTTTGREVEVTVNGSTVVTGDAGFVDENGNIIYYDENGHVVETKSDNGYDYYGGFKADGKGLDVKWYAVDESGNKVGGNVFSDNANEKKTTDKETGKYIDGLYCVDGSISIKPYGEYRLANLEDVIEENYINEEEAKHLRAIVTNGYVWDSVKGSNNLDEMNQALREAGILADGEALTNEQAASITQAAIWKYANRIDVDLDTLVLEIGGVRFDKEENQNNPMVKAYNYLSTLTMEAPAEEKQIINEEKFVEDMSFTVGTKVENHDNNKDDDDTNDVYNTSIKFSLVVAPDKANDDLIVKVVDDQGNVVKEARIAGQNTADGKQYDDAQEVTENGKTYYVLEGIELGENSNTVLNLKLEGTQLLTEGVYIFESADSPDEINMEAMYSALAGLLRITPEDAKEICDSMTEEELREELLRSQNLITKFSGSASVSVTAQIDMTFNVEEETVVTTRTWRTEEIKGAATPINDEDPNPNPNPAPRFRGDTTELKALDDVLLTIEEEAVPLAVAPITGDTSAVWSVVSVAALAAYLVLSHKRKDN